MTTNTYPSTIVWYCISVSLNVHSLKKVPEIDHSKSSLKEIFKNLSAAKLAPLSSILIRSSSRIWHLICSKCSILLVYQVYKYETGNFFE